MTGVLGAEPVPGGTRFTVASAVAHRVELALFDEGGAIVEHRDLSPVGDGDWTVTVDGVGPGRRYGFRVHGPADPAAGHACDPSVVLIDPMARRLTGDPAVSVVGEPATAPRLDGAIPWDRTVIYEAHVGHLTARHPDVPAEQRGRFPGLCAPPVLDHLRTLGVTTVELLPIQHFVSEPDLVATGRENVWGYNPLAWAAPHEGYASPGGDPVAELRDAVAGLHRAGFEVVLDVVFNHTCEGAFGAGATRSWRGFDNAAAYRLRPGAEGGPLVDDDVTGCGNTVDLRSPWIRRLVIGALERWITEFGVDGFRFDLAPALLRGDGEPAADAPILAELDALVARHPGVKLIAEPWDLGPGGYRLGRFPDPWREWNDRFREDVRARWAGAGSWPAFADAIMGSNAVFGADRRPVTASVNAVVTHDGPTLADLVAGTVQDRDGRDRLARALLGTVALAQGVPLVLSGDELGRSQGGSLDGYTLPADRWGVDWAAGDRDLAAWVAAALELRRSLPALHRDDRIHPADDRVTWLDGDGGPRDDGGWSRADHPFLGLRLAGDAEHPDALVLVVPDPVVVEILLPPGVWTVALDARELRPVPAGERSPLSGALTLDGPTLVVLRGSPSPGPEAAG